MASKSEYDRAYSKKNVVKKLIPFSRIKPSDVELYEWLCSQPNMTAYIKNLIREDMELHKNVDSDLQKAENTDF